MTLGSDGSGVDELRELVLAAGDGVSSLSITALDTESPSPVFTTSGNESFQNIYLRNACLSWDSIRLSSLKSLCLHGLRNDWPSPDHIIASLRSSPLLETLIFHLWSSGPDEDAELDEGPEATDTSPIQLPALKHLAIGRIPENMASALLSGIRAPALASFHLYDAIQVEDWSISDGEPVDPVLRMVSAILLRAETVKLRNEVAMFAAVLVESAARGRTCGLTAVKLLACPSAWR